MNSGLLDFTKANRLPAAFLVLFVPLIVFFPLEARPVEDTLKSTLGRDGLLIENEMISLKVSDGLLLEPSLKKDGRLLSIVSGRERDRSSFQIKISGRLIDHFQVDWARLVKEDISDSLGRGKRFLIKARAESYDSSSKKPILVTAEASLSFYENFPSAVICAVKFTNSGRERLEIDEVLSGFLRLDRRLVDKDEKPYLFASYHGSQVRWGEDYSLVWVTRDFERPNIMKTHLLSSGLTEGGGTPLVDLWTPRCGLALASAEPSPQWISLPVRTADDGLVEISLVEAPEEALGQKKYLKPGDSYSSIHSALILHQLDFFDPIRVYADLLRAQGVKIPLSSPRQAFEPYWKSWGFNVNFTQEKIFTVLTELKKIGVGWANLDDGWFTYHGDWKPNPAPGKFPGGDADMASFVDRLHRQGFKSGIWWYAQGVSPESDLARTHPDWLVKNEDGSFPKSVNRDYYLCPVYFPCLEYIKGMVRKIMVEWGFDELYLDFQGQSTTPPCFNPAHNHTSPLDSYTRQFEFYEAIYRTAQEIKPDCPVEMCICAMPHDPFKMPFYNVASASDPVNLNQMRQRVKLEKAYRGTGFCVGDCYQVPINEWYGSSVPESFESAMGTGAQVTTFFRELTPEQEKKWEKWIAEYRNLGLARAEYLNLYDLAFDKPEGHAIRKEGTLYYGFFAPYWSATRPIELRGLEKGRKYRVRDYANGIDLGEVSGDKPLLNRGFKEQLLLEVKPL